MNRRRFFKYSGLSLGAVAFSKAGAGPLFGQTMPTVRVSGLSGGMTAVAANLLVRSGAARRQGLNVEVKPFGADLSVQNFLQGLSDVSFDFGPSQLAISSPRFAVTMLNSVLCSPNVVITRTDSGIDSMDDLLNYQQRRGRKPKLGIFGRDSSNFNELSVLLAVKFGVDRPRLEQIFDLAEASPPGLIPLLQRGDVDAATLFDPLALRAEIAADAKIIFGPYSQEFEKMWGTPKILSGIAVTVDYVRNNLDIMRRFQDAWIDTVEWASRNGYEFFRENQFQELTGIREDAAITRLIERTIQLPLLVARWDQAMKETQRKYLRTAAQQGILPSAPDTVLADIEDFA